MFYDEITAREILDAIIAKLPAGKDQAAGDILDGYLDACNGMPNEYLSERKTEIGAFAKWRANYETGYYLHNKNPMTFSARKQEILALISLMLGVEYA